MKTKGECMRSRDALERTHDPRFPVLWVIIGIVGINVIGICQSRIYGVDPFQWQGLVAHTIMGAIVGVALGALFLRRWNSENVLSARNRDLEQKVHEAVADLEKANEDLKHEMRERKRASTQLQESLIRQNALLDNIPDMAWLKDKNGTFLAVNDQFAKARGIPREELVGRTDFDFWPEELAKRYLEDDQQVMETGQRKIIEETLVHSPDRDVWIETIKSPIYDDTGEIVGTAGIGRNITRRKQIADELRASEEKYRSLVDNAPVGIISIDGHGAVTEVNPKLMSILGFSSTAETGSLNVLTFSPFVEAGISDAVKAMLEDPRSLCIETPYTAQGEKTSYLRIVGTPMRDSKGTVLGIQASVEDISDRKRAEEDLRRAHDEMEARVKERTAEIEATNQHLRMEISERIRAERALLESEERYRNLVEGSFDGIFVRRNGKIMFANSRLCEMFGYERLELEGLERWDIYHPTDREKVRDRAMARLKNLDVPPRYGVRLQRKDGSTFPGELDARVAVFRGEPAIQVWVRDISERVQAEEERLLLVAAIEHAAELIVILDSKARIRYVNPAFKTATGYRDEEVVGRTANTLSVGGTSEAFSAEMWSSLIGGEVWSGRFTHTRKEGESFEAEATISPVKGADNSIVSFVAVVRDVTRELALEKQLRQAQKMEAIGTLAAGIAHDFNNILWSVIGFTELAMDDVPKDSTARANLRNVLLSGQRAKDLVSQILSISRPDEQSRRPVDIRPIVKETIKFLRSSIPTTIEIRTRIDSKIGHVVADPTQIHQVLMNLCTNARHAMGTAPGMLELSLDQVELSAKIGGLTPGQYARITVQDSGCGIPSDRIDRIFEPYFTTKERGEGTGLGLSVVHGIVNSHGGRIEVESRRNAGSTFRIYLPVLDGPHKEQEHHPDHVLPKGMESILFVDDEPAIVTMSEQILKRLGYRVTALSSSLEALEAFRDRPGDFDLIITDVTMPKLSGTQLIREVRDIRGDIPVVLCTGYSELVNDDLSSSLGIQEIIMKPILQKEMAQAIRRALGGGLDE
jgi:PAS domain S-box-containing protein